jgi:TP901 family phage tail tape measure protein
MANEKITLELDLETGNVSGAFDKVKNKARRSGEESANRFKNAFSSNLKGLAAGVVGFAAIERTLTTATRSAIEFQTAFNEINTLLPETQKLTEGNAEAFRDFAGEFGTSAARQANAFYQIVSSGVTDTAQANELLTQANKLAVGGVTDVNNAIDILTTTINAYGQENLTAQDAADSLFTAVKLGKTTIEELSQSLALVIPSARSAGVSLDTANAAVATLATQGFKTSDAVTRVNALFTALARNGRKLGKGFNLAAVQSDGLLTVLQRLQKRTNGQADALIELLGTQEAFQAVQALAKNEAQDFANTLDQFSSKAGAAGAAFQQIANTDAFKLRQSLSQLNVVLDRLGAQLLPSVVNGLQAFSKTVDFFAGKTILKPDDITNQEQLNDAVADTNQKLQALIRQRDAIQDGGLFFRGGPRDQKTLADINREIEKLEKNQADLIRKRRELNGTLKETQKIAQETATAPGQAQTDIASPTPPGSNVTDTGVGLDKQGKLSLQFQKDLQQLQVLREQKVISDLEFQERQLQLQREFNARRRDLALQQEANQIASFDNIAAGFEASAKRQILTARNLANTVNNTISSGIGDAFTNVGQAFKKGENGAKAFEQGIISTFGSVASAAGDLYIKKGVAQLFLNPATGAGLIAAGGALKILGSQFGQPSGGSSTNGVGGGTIGPGSPGEPIETSPIDQEQPLEQAQEQSAVTVNIDRFVGEEEEARRVAEILSEAGAKNGTLLTDVRSFA